MGLGARRRVDCAARGRGSAAASAGRVRARARVSDVAPRLCCRLLHHNSLSGAIPSELGQLSALQDLCAARPRPAPAAAPPRHPPSPLAVAVPPAPRMLSALGASPAFRPAAPKLAPRCGCVHIHACARIHAHVHDVYRDVYMYMYRCAYSIVYVHLTCTCTCARIRTCTLLCTTIRTCYIWYVRM